MGRSAVDVAVGSVGWGYDRIGLRQSQSVAVPGQSRNSSVVLRAVDAIVRLFMTCSEVNTAAIFRCSHCNRRLQRVKFVVVERL